MKSSNFKLYTIAIPTINRVLLLKNLLNDLNNQIVKFDLINDVEIIVSDNSDNFETKEMIEELINQLNIDIKYYRNENILKKTSEFHSFDTNIDNLFRKSNTNYTWILGDDDYITENAVKVVFDIIKNLREKFINIYIDSLRPFTNISDDIITNDKNNFFKITKFRSGAVTANIFNTTVWRETIHQKDLGTGWIHSIYLVKNLGREKSYIYKDSLKGEYINLQEHKSSQIYKKVLNNDFYFNAYLNKLLILHTLKNYGFSNELIKLAYNYHYNKFFYRLMSFKYKGLILNAGVKKKFLKATYNLGLLRYFYYYSMYLMPVNVLKFYRNFIKKN